MPVTWGCSLMSKATHEGDKRGPYNKELRWVLCDKYRELWIGSHEVPRGRWLLTSNTEINKLGVLRCSKSPEQQIQRALDWKLQRWALSDSAEGLWASHFNAGCQASLLKPRGLLLENVLTLHSYVSMCGKQMDQRDLRTWRAAKQVEVQRGSELRHSCRQQSSHVL